MLLVNVKFLYLDQVFKYKIINTFEDYKSTCKLITHLQSILTNAILEGIDYYNHNFTCIYNFYSTKQN
jgi:hypothetical protein